MSLISNIGFNKHYLYPFPMKFKSFTSIILFPFTLVYRFIISVRNSLYDMQLLKSHEFKVPVISIGNITVGGTGKTPHTEYLIDLLQSVGKIAVLSRGYKRKSKGFVVVSSSSPASEVGDEPLQVKRKYSFVQVAVDADRVHGINQLMNEDNELKVVLLDDAFQHRAVMPGVNILLIDYNRPIYEDVMLPSGRLREPFSSRFRANIVILTKCPDVIRPIDQRLLTMKLELKAYQTLYFTRFTYSTPIAVFEHEALEWFYSNEEIKPAALLVTGIAQAKPFTDYTKKIVNTAEHLSYPDHYQFVEKDYSSIIAKFDQMKETQKVILTTEKDAARLRFATNLPLELKKALYYIPIQVEFLDNGKAQFDQQILSYITKNKRNSLLYR